MKNFLLTSLAAGALAAAALGLTATANAAPTGPSAVDAINQLRTKGFKVIVNRVGTAPLERCTVSSGSPRPDVLAHRFRCTGAGDDLVSTVTGKTVYVDISC